MYPGSYELKLSHPHYVKYSETVTIAPSETLTKCIALKRGATITGTVRDGNSGQS